MYKGLLGLKIAFKSLLISWLLFFQQVLAVQEFTLNSRGLLFIQDFGAPLDREDFRNTKTRMTQLGLAFANSPLNRNRAASPLIRQLREDSLRLANVNHGSWNEAHQERLDRIRQNLGQLQISFPDEFRSVLTSNPNIPEGLLVATQLQGLDQTVLTGENSPHYCQQYPLLDRETLEGFYRGVSAGEGSQCLEFGEQRLSLDLNDIGEVMTSLEGDIFRDQTRELRNGLILTSINGILNERTAYSGLYPNTESDLSRLKDCANNIAPSRMGNNDLSIAIDTYENGLADNLEHLNNRFTIARREALLANQIREALILGSLYSITSAGTRYQESDGTVTTVIRAHDDENFSDQVQQNCHQRFEREYGFTYYDSMENNDYVQRRCEELIQAQTVTNFEGCRERYTEALNNFPEHDPAIALRQCFFEENGTPERAPRSFQINQLLPILASKVEANPLLFQREDHRSLVPFTSSESEFVPSSFANQILSLPGASDISQQVEMLLASDPEDPYGAIEELLSGEDIDNQLRTIIQSAQSNEGINNLLRDEITSYQNELTDSAVDVCQNDGEHLHHFPHLVNDVIENNLGTISAEQREDYVIRMQGAQCWMLQNDPPEETGGLPVGVIALGVGAIALGMVPGIGWIAAGTLIAAGTGVTAVDAIDRAFHAQGQYEATAAAFAGGWADSQQLLLAAEARTDAETLAWAEGLSVGILDIGGLAIRAARAGRTADTYLQRHTIAHELIETNAGLTLLEREALIRRSYPQLNDSQVSTIIRAHAEVRCPIYRCSNEQLRRKIQIMQESEPEVPLEVRREIIRLGIAGFGDESLDIIYDLELYRMRMDRSEMDNPENIATAFQSPVVRDFYDLDSNEILYRSSISTRDLEMQPLTMPDHPNTIGALDFSDVQQNPDDYIVLYHGRGPNGAGDIFNNGINLTRGDGEFGQGMYFTSSYDQALAWARMNNGDDGVVLQTFIPRSALEQVHRRGATIEFPMNAANPEDSSEVAHLFTNFVNANRLIRRSENPDMIDPVGELDFISGPSVSMSQDVFDQVKFGNTEAMRELFASDSPQMLTRMISGPAN